MAKELYIYSPIYDFTSETVVSQLNDIPESEDLTMRLNTPGGKTGSGWSIISKMSERSGKIFGIVDGDAMSMGAMMLLFMDNSIANDTSRIMFHKAAYPSWYEPTEDEKKQLKTINSIFQEKLTKKVDGKPGAKAFLDKVFETDVRNDVEISPKEAKKLGIINEVRKLEPKAYHGMQIVAMMEENEQKTPTSGENNNNNNQNIKSMDLNQLRTENPALYAEVFGLGEKAGISAEKQRVEAWAVYYDIDPAKVKAGIEGEGAPTVKDQNEFVLASINSKKVKAMEEESPEDVNIPEEAKTEEEIKAEAQKAEMDELFNEKGE